MLRHFWSVKRDVTIDECPECSGVFLDLGELGRIRVEFSTEQARHAAADGYFGEVVDPVLEQAHEQTEEELERSRTFAHALRFVCPSWYIPGRRAGAAF